MSAAGVTTFVEVGPGGVLSRLATATLAESGLPGEALALDSGRKPGALDLALLLAPARRPRSDCEHCRVGGRKPLPPAARAEAGAHRSRLRRELRPAAANAHRPRPSPP